MTRGLARAWFLGMLLVISGCGSDSESNAAPKVPTVRLGGLIPSEGATWTWEDADTADGELVLPCDGRIVVTTGATDWTPRPPGGCGLTQLCGHVEVVATAESGATNTAFAVSNALLRLPVDTLGAWVGSGSVRARLVRDDNTPYLDPTGGEITATRNVLFSAAVSCESSGAGGNGAAGGADSGGAGDSGAGGSGAQSAGGASN